MVLGKADYLCVRSLNTYSLAALYKVLYHEFHFNFHHLSRLGIDHRCHANPDFGKGSLDTRRNTLRYVDYKFKSSSC